MYRFICMLSVKKYACKIVLFFTQCKTKHILLWFCGCTQDVLRYANRAVKKISVSPESKRINIKKSYIAHLELSFVLLTAFFIIT